MMDDDVRFEAACKAFNLLPEANKELFYKLAAAKVYEHVQAHDIDPVGLKAFYHIGLSEGGELWIVCDFFRDDEVVEERVPLVRLLAFQSVPFVQQVRVQ